MSDKNGGVVDCREEFKIIRPKIIKTWIIIVMIFIGVIPFTAVSGWLTKNGYLKATFAEIAIFAYGFVYLAAIFSLFRFKCPACGASLYVLLSAGKIPVIVKSWVSRDCTHCGARLK